MTVVIPFKVISNTALKINRPINIYIDPYKIDEEYHDAQAVLITHPHKVNFSPEDIARIIADGTHIIMPASMSGEAASLRLPASGLHLLRPHDFLELKIGTEVLGIRAYSAYDESSHPQEKGWLGYLIELAGERFFYTGDTMLLPEHEKISADYAFFSIGCGVMSISDAVAYAIGKKLYTAVPIHCESACDIYRFNYLYTSGRLPELQQTFRKMGLPDTVFEETSTDIDAKRAECLRDYGVDGLPGVYNWYGKFLAGRIRRYGRLEYELLPREEAERRFSAAVLPSMGEENWIVNVHIPSNGGSLSKENLEDSFAKAYKAYAVNEHYFSDNVMRLVCSSWLLSDILAKILSENSGIMLLQREFDIIGFRENPDFNEKDYIWGNECKQPIETWSENSSLKRGIKRFLISGGVFRDGLGVKSCRK